MECEYLSQPLCVLALCACARLLSSKSVTDLLFLQLINFWVSLHWPEFLTPECFLLEMARMEDTRTVDHLKRPEYSKANCPNSERKLPELLLSY
jgi:hypothetical protein